MPLGNAHVTFFLFQSSYKKCFGTRGWWDTCELTEESVLLTGWTCLRLEVKSHWAVLKQLQRQFCASVFWLYPVLHNSIQLWRNCNTSFRVYFVQKRWFLDLSKLKRGALKLHPLGCSVQTNEQPPCSPTYSTRIKTGGPMGLHLHFLLPASRACWPLNRLHFLVRCWVMYRSGPRVNISLLCGQ